MYSSVFTLILQSGKSLLKFFIPASLLALSLFAVWHYAPKIQAENALYLTYALCGCAIIIAFVFYHAGQDIFYAYGLGFSAIAGLYACIYYAYGTYALVPPVTLFWLLTGIACAAGYIAVRFNGWLLALLGLVMAGITPYIVLAILTRFFLAWYFIALFFIVMTVAYIRRWFELALLSFLIFLAYNPWLFSQTDLEGTKGLLSIYQVLEVMVAIFFIYTIIPWLNSLCCPKKRIFEPICFALAGSYTAAIIHFVIEGQLSLVAQMPFFIRYFVKKGMPLMNDVYMYMFIIYGTIYLCLFLLLFLINRHAKVPLGALASLIIICTVSIIYTHAKATGLLPTAIRVKKIVEQAVQQIQS